MILQNKNVHYPRLVEACRLRLWNKKTQQNTEKHTQSGRSMIEMMGVLAIVGVLSAGGIAGYNMAMQSYKTNALIEKIQLISVQTRKLYKGDYSNIKIQDLVDTGLLSDTKSPFGVSFGLASNANGYFSIYLKPVPKDTCVDLVMNSWGNIGTFRTIWVGHTSGQGWFDIRDGSWPTTLDKAISACEASNGHIDIYFY